MNKLIISYFFIAILLVSNLYFIIKTAKLQKEIFEIKRPIEIQKINEKVLNFTKFFIEKVLKAEGEVDFETRLKLETAVRELNDEEILAQWQKFVNSKTEGEAQQEVKNLLELLVSKIKSD
jgi:hypothetical protein